MEVDRNDRHLRKARSSNGQNVELISTNIKILVPMKIPEDLSAYRGSALTNIFIESAICEFVHFWITFTG